MAEESEDGGERSEEPTQRRLEEARKRGDIAKSQEVNSWFLLAGGTLALAMFGRDVSSELAAQLGGLLGDAAAVSFDGRALQALAMRLSIIVGVAIGLPVVILCAGAVLGHVVQNGVVWTLDPITPRLSKISPLAGLKRVFSKRSLALLLKGVLKLAIVGAALTFVVWPERARLETLPWLDLSRLGPYLLDLVLRAVSAALAVLAVVAALDWLFERQSWLTRQRMSLREIKEEFKQQEGDPHIKARIRQLRLQRGRRRMMARLPEASVVIANPTHYAVALKYETGMNAPLCIAKGADRVALRIRELAEEHGVPVVENPPLARALHAVIEIDGEVPSEYYRAVAEIIGYVMRLKRGRLQ